MEKARCQICQLDIELELKQGAAATAKSERDAARDMARLVDLDKQAATSQLKKEALLVDLDRLVLVIVLNLHAEEVGGLAEVRNGVAFGHEPAIVVKSLVGAHTDTVVDECSSQHDNMLTFSIDLDICA